MDVTTHELIISHARQDLKIFGCKGILCPHQRKVNVVPNAAGRAEVSLLLPLVGHKLLFWAWGDLLY